MSDIDTVQIDEEQCWQAVLARDPRADGTFVTAVRTTGIYCRPTCPARHPRRENVTFFPRPDLAERAGFRACLRCRPNDRPTQLQMVEDARRYIEAHLDRTVTLEELGEAVSVSPHHLQRVFKKVIGISPRAWADARRLEELKDGLRARENVTSAMYDAGYGSSSRLYERAPAQLGMTPGAYRRGGKGMCIGYTIVDSPLGRLLVGATERGVCAVSLGDDDATLEAALTREYPAAQIARDDTGLTPWVEPILRHLAGIQPHLELPIDVQVTAFQRRVLDALRTIPYGATRTYAEVARSLGQPSATRAVARACATNPVAVVVPCHRVIGADGSLTGYRWGIERKRTLLEHEQQPAAQPITA
jgi:AraC family transcriptional regulator of adaptative response/methylated-DNA-[protein]-cysteine methyltransferase